MNKKNSIFLSAALIMLLLISACGTQLNSESPDIQNKDSSKSIQEDSAAENQPSSNSETSNTVDLQPSETNQENTDGNDESAEETKSSDTKSTEQNDTNQEKNAVGNLTETDNEILIIIDQTAKPIEGNSFDFVVNKAPKGFTLSEIQWISKKNQVINTIQEAIEHGATGEEGFYISGNGQYSGFIYPDSMKGEEGQVVFIFKDDQGKEITWKKNLTLY